MKIINSLKMAMRNILTNKLRSGLTMLGIIIGIASVIALVGIGNGAASAVTESVSSLGADILSVQIYSDDTGLTESEVESLASLDNVTAAVPYKSVSATVSRNSTSASRTTIMAVDSKYVDINNLTLASGRLISFVDNTNASKVCIIGSDLASTLFSLADPVGQNVKIDGDEYTVIGVLEETGTSMGTDVDNMLLIPYNTAVYLGADTTYSSLYLQISDTALAEQTVTAVENYLRMTLQISSDDYAVTSSTSMISAMEDVSTSLALMLGGIASISLLVGGIGVMNVMLVSVTERTREIGIRKALGARRKDILLQFLIEAVVISLLGGIIGILLGLFAGVIIQNLGTSFACSSSIILLAFAVSAAIGLIFGSFPAYRASALSPIEALRAE